MSWDIKPGDTLIHINRNPDFLGKQIQLFQKVAGFDDPAWRATHVEIVLEINGDIIKTFSQTFPTAVYNYLDYKITESLLDGPEFHNCLFRVINYNKVVNRLFLSGMRMRADEIIKNGPKGWAKFLPRGFYNVLGLPSYWLNFIAHKLGWKNHLPWLNIPGGLLVCSEAGASINDAGWVSAWGTSPIFKEPNSEVCPASWWKEPNFIWQKQL